MLAPEAWPESSDGAALPDEPLLFLYRLLGEIVHLWQCSPGRFQSLSSLLLDLQPLHWETIMLLRQCRFSTSGKALVCSSVATCFTLRQADALSDLPDRERERERER